MQPEYRDNIPLTKRYLEFVADALGQQVGENSRYHLVDKFPNIVIQDDEDEELDDEVEIEDEFEHEPEQRAKPDKIAEHHIEQPKPTERPRFSAPHRRDDGQWVIRFEYFGQHYSWVGNAENIKEAMVHAWQAYFD
ncbi:hypothetical protein [Xenorhabdus thuongxuanensis]|uniref:Protelomerase n=1 Tax=Xenorhabdus thuongxuanensis TaxID=1873484 RepID=A0A1Q5U2Y2_9GAMM|nr:hypothetical protein [Xenorhabdus thuongxuanensis]OKP06852.1 protelomerase [Xenorhabdus thuongxuanensis]